MNRGLLTPILAFVIGIFFLISVHFFFFSYHDLKYTRDGLDALKVRSRLMRKEKADRDRARRMLDQVHQFMDKSRDLGLSEVQWMTYDVTINEPVSFLEFSRILEQCANTSSYYFRPITLDARLPRVEDFEGPKGELTEGHQGDVLLTLSGRFLVKKP